MRSVKFLSIVLLLAVILTACAPGGGGAAQPKELKVAILAPLSGPVPTFGVSTRDGASWPLTSGMPRAVSWA